MSVLVTKELSKNFGGLAAISNININLEKNSIIGIIGPNGAGKTTLFNLLTGIYVPSHGEIFIHEVPIKATKPHQFAKHHVARTFQNIRLFKNQTVLENIMVSFYPQMSYQLLDSLFRTKKYYDQEQVFNEKAQSLLTLVGLNDKMAVLASNLSYGEQRKLEIARALACQPKLLFLDEPAAGMNPIETQELTALILQIQKQFDLSIILIEHDMGLVMKLSEQIYVLDYGKCIAQGTPTEIKQNRKVIKAYLGEDEQC